MHSYLGKNSLKCWNLTVKLKRLKCNAELRHNIMNIKERKVQDHYDIVSEIDKNASEFLSLFRS